MKRPTARKGRALWRSGLLAFGLLLVALAGFAQLIRDAEQRAAAYVEGRFRLRAEIAARFLHTYVVDLLARERLLAQAELSGPSPRDEDLVRVARAFGFHAAALLDPSGKLELAYPPQPQMVGRDMVTPYPHLREAAARGEAVSGVVASIAAKAPVVGFATRYDTPHGPRVLTGAYHVTRTPLRAYISTISPIPTATVELVDADGFLVASSRDENTHKQKLGELDAHLAAASGSSDHGSYAGERGERLFETQPIEGTGWRIIASVDMDALYKPVGGRANRVYWVLYAGFCVVLLAAAYLFWRLLESRRELRAMNADLARLARIDGLTGLPNRLHLEEQLVRLRSAARRQSQPLSVFLVDVDHFKNVNDSYGHAGGDEVLRTLAARMSAALRVEDVLGRWGGEEFLCVLPNTEATVVSLVAERVRAAASREPIVLGTGESVRVTVSIGCASLSTDLEDDMLRRADAALYRAKQGGRDRVVSSVAPPPDDRSTPPSLSARTP